MTDGPPDYWWDGTTWHVLDEDEEPPPNAYRDLFDGSPLDGTRLAADIAASCPEANQEVRP